MHVDFLLVSNILRAVPFPSRLDRYQPFGRFAAESEHRFFCALKSNNAKCPMKTSNLAAVMQPAVVERKKDFDTTTSLAILKEFYSQAKRELKKNGQTTVNFRKSEEVSHLTFFCDGFNLELTFTQNC